ncbi:hypothetical protein [Deinococcus aerophilus]|uniref:YbjN domain-containing protein n=1 Tax=Deinococcus aerophilus TaxID=522488 RepID=A0ABQ2GXP3_9DEIO|nr:hypothetical protein [Deinococcus aerophilus]GGM16866.1 hypothetical protein GCM10010841_26460 [Deinococcus aerophilus]
MTRIWTDADPFDEPPPHPLLRAIGDALSCLEPVLRSVQYDAAGPQPCVTVGFGGAWHLAGIRILDEDTLLLDLPVGEVDQAAEVLAALLAENLGGPWLYRVDGPSRGARLIVVIEHLMPLADLPDLPGRLLAGWQEKLIRQGLLEALGNAGGTP